MRATRPAHLRGGFTLIEAMMASIILSFCVVALASAMMAATQQSVATKARQSALNAARSGMEILAAYPLSDMYVPGGPSTQTIDSSAFPAGAGLTRTAQVSFITRSAAQGAYDLAVAQVTVVSADCPTVTLYRLISKEGNGQ